MDNLSLDYIAGNAVDDSDGRITMLQATDQVTYTGLGWDFEGVWQMVSGFDFPQLRFDVLTITAGTVNFDPDEADIIVPITFSSNGGNWVTNGISFTVTYDTAKLVYTGYDFALPGFGLVYVLEPTPGTITVSIISPGLDLSTLGDLKLIFTLASGYVPLVSNITDIILSFGPGQGAVLSSGISRENIRLIDGFVRFDALLMGDINGDNIITIADADLLAQMILNLIPWTNRAKLVGDVNGDGVIDLVDVAIILSWI
ncbi:MAG: dockerin type I domain-containing protein [Clostridiales bacterium]|jgi:hypothetical protein|nr:dockerin type I domain-containing protein [Clostridiales bacterium]